MTKYRFIPPIMNRSTKLFDIMDENENRVGEMQRYFTFGGQNFISMIINMAHVRVNDLSNDVSLDFKERSLIKNFLFNKWDVLYSSNKKVEKFELIDKTKIKTNQRIIYTIEDRNMEVKSEILDRITRFYKMVEGKSYLVAEVSYKKIIPPVTYTMELFDESIHVCEIAGVYYLMQLNGSD